MTGVQGVLHSLHRTDNGRWIHGYWMDFHVGWVMNDELWKGKKYSIQLCSQWDYKGIFFFSTFHWDNARNRYNLPNLLLNSNVESRQNESTILSLHEEDATPYIHI